MISDATAVRVDDRDAVQAALQKFVPDIQVVDTTGHDWTVDEFSKGGWMMHRPGNLTCAAPQMRKLHGRVRFAGSDIASVEPGSIEGAMESGAAAAQEVAALLNKMR
jgi:monoamine oxidase